MAPRIPRPTIFPSEGNDPKGAAVALRALEILKGHMSPDAQAAVMASIETQRRGTVAKVVALRSLPEMKESRIITDWREVSDRMGGLEGRFFGANFLKSVRGIAISEAQIPKIHITEQEISNARKMGDMISLHPRVLGNGKPSTMVGLDENEIAQHNHKALFAPSLYDKQTFAHAQGELEWRQTSTHPISGTYGMNFFQQTDLLASHFADNVMGGQLLSFREKHAFHELENRRAELELLMQYWEEDHRSVKLSDGKPAKNWYVAAGILAGLEITTLTRPTAIALLNDMVNARLVGIPMLVGDYTSVSDRYDFGHFVSLGLDDGRGARVNNLAPTSRGLKMGAIFSCSRSA